MPMKRYYRKPSLTYEAQADQLVARGLHAERSILISRLKSVSYYRLSGYWYPLRKDHPSIPNGKLDDFQEGSSLEKVWTRYRFDRKLRFLMLDAVERIEIAIRTKLVYYFTQDKGAFKYADSDLFPKWKEHRITVKKLEYQSGFRSPSKKGKRNDKRDAFINNFLEKYCNAHLPFWMMAELMDFGSMSRFIENTDYTIKQKIAKDFELPIDVFLSWLNCLNTLRNACAHHSRIWNKVWGTKPLLPTFPRQNEWYYVYSDTEQQWVNLGQRHVNENRISCAYTQGRTAALIAICRYMQKRIIPHSRWKQRMNALFKTFETQNVSSYMGLPEHWQKHPLWK